MDHAATAWRGTSGTPQARIHSGSAVGLRHQGYVDFTPAADGGSLLIRLARTLLSLAVVSACVALVVVAVMHFGG